MSLNPKVIAAVEQLNFRVTVRDHVMGQFLLVECAMDYCSALLHTIVPL
jgi:hypothetical protein